MLPAQPNQGLIDGLACLQALASEGRPVGVRELARRLGLTPTRVNRLLGTLAHLELARRTPERKYEVGPAIHVLSVQSLFGSGLIRRALGPLESLHGEGLSVALGVLWRDQVSYLYHAEPGMSPAQGIGRAGLFPATHSSIGMVLLAQQEEAAVVSLYAGQSIPGYPEGLDALLHDLRQIRAQGWACVAPNPPSEVNSAAVPIGNLPYAGIALAGCFGSDRLPQLLEALSSAAQQIEAVDERKHS
ncbi:MAG TPA: helix-turn-helix domain-containing protein [Armatimonadota bacterium]|nr:helix-turn-helix domain-containing protein [Armatimonadota bacterium]